MPAFYIGKPIAANVLLAVHESALVLDELVPPIGAMIGLTHPHIGLYIAAIMDVTRASGVRGRERTFGVSLISSEFVVGTLVHASLVLA